MYWELVAKAQAREAVAADAQIDPELLTVKGMVQVLFPDVVRQTGEQLAARERDTLNSSDLWDLPGGATGDQCYEIVRTKVEKRKADAARVAQNKEQRIQKRREHTQSENQLGSRIVSALTHVAQIKQLKVDQLRAALAFRGVEIPKEKQKKADLQQLLTTNMMDLATDGTPPPFNLEPATTEAPACAPATADEGEGGPSNLDGHESDPEAPSDVESEDDVVHDYE